jgi:NAD(P)-dependent dehydrogenase (short-subunit alcohol dehydrogenase family)
MEGDNMNDFSGKTIIVTGGAQGIGGGIVEYLLDRKCQIVMSDIDVEAGQELVEHLARPERLLFVHTDVSKEQQVMQCIAETLQFSGRIDGLVNNAGTTGQQFIVDGGMTRKMIYAE